MNVHFLHADSPSNVAVSAARTCYFPNGLVTPEQSSMWERKPALLEAIFKGGHHTTLQHTHITLLIDGMSRHLIWRLLHAHPYYNSEQVSQRYAKMKKENMVYPKNGNTVAWQNYYNDCFSAYERLIELLMDDVQAVTPKFRQKDVKKRAQEVARYLLPAGTSAYLYHTVNIITLLRYIAVANTLQECQSEAQQFADIIATKLLELDPLLEPLVTHAKGVSLAMPVDSIQRVKARNNALQHQEVKIFDVVGSADFTVDARYGDVLRGAMMQHDEGVLGGFSTYMKISLSADAQNQRHRRSLAIRDAIATNFKEDAYTPPIIANNSEASALYAQMIEQSYRFYKEQSAEIGEGEAIYALSNAHKIEVIERNDFSSFHHKAQMRLCYNAQQEIYDIVYEQVRQLREEKVAGAENFLPPCSVRNALKMRPICPEGDHFCGVKVWKLDFNAYERKL